MTRLIGLYPRPWRDRYEAEFRDLLAARPPGIGDRIDIIRAALDEHLRPQVPGPGRVRDRIGVAPLAGFVAFLVAIVVAANGPIRYDEYGMYRDGALGIPLFIASLVLLSIGLHRVVERLPDDATAARAAGWTAIVLGPLWSLMPWVYPVGFVFMLAVLGLVVGAPKHGIWPASSEIVLVGALAVPAGLLLALPFLPWYTMRVVGFSFAIVMIPLSISMLVVGWVVFRGAPKPELASQQ
jgi:hypothetical protein